jgi:4-hydroxybenzoate polyprenyltransferase
LGFGLAIILGSYLMLNSFLPFGKEFIIAAGYVIGVLLPSSISINHVWDNPVFLLCFFIDVLFNVFMFSYFDVETDTMENRKSVVRTLGLKRVHVLFVVLFTLQLVLTAFVTDNQMSAAILLIGMTVIMGVIIYVKNSLSITLCRIIGEGVFMLPGWYWVFTN